MSGRMRGYVYSWHHGRLHWHRYVVPKDPRTPGQRRSRAAFGKAAKAWSEIQPLTEEHRDAWHAEAAKIKTRAHLAQSGPRTAQQHFVGRNSIKERWGLPLLLEPPTGERKKAESGMQNTRPAPQAPQSQRLKPTSWEPRRACTGPPPDLHREPKGRAGMRNALRVPIQMQHCQALTRASSDRPQTSSRPLPQRFLGGR
jgi:hypothetical protein